MMNLMIKRIILFGLICLTALKYSIQNVQEVWQDHETQETVYNVSSKYSIIKIHICLFANCFNSPM